MTSITGHSSARDIPSIDLTGFATRIVPAAQQIAGTTDHETAARSINPITEIADVLAWEHDGGDPQFYPGFASHWAADDGDRYEPSSEDEGYELGYRLGLAGETPSTASDIDKPWPVALAMLKGHTDGAWERREFQAWRARFEADREREAFAGPDDRYCYAEWVEAMGYASMGGGYEA